MEGTALTQTHDVKVERSLSANRLARGSRDYGIVMFLVILCVTLSFATDTFLTVRNFENIFTASVPVALIACAGTLVLIGGGFDLSAGSIFSVAAIVCALVANGTNPAIGALAALVCAALLGAVNGFICTFLQVNHFVGTIGTSIAFAGLAVGISGTRIIVVDDPSIANLAYLHVLGIDSGTWIMLLGALLCGFILNHTVLGSHLFGTGGNLAAARLSGVRVNWIITIAYIVSGVFAGLAALVVVGQTQAVTSTSGSNLLFTALAALLIGGSSVNGGEGAIWRTMVGVLILMTINNGFNLLGVDPLYQQGVNGIVILVAVSVDAWLKRTR